MPAPTSARMAVLAGLVLAAAAASAVAQAPASAPTPPPVDAAKLYQDKCDFCHGGGLAPVITGRGLSVDAIKAIARSGRGDMPVFAAKDLGDADLAALADWISKSKSGDAGK